MKTIEECRAKGIRICDTVPEGFYRITGAGNAPKGYRWYNNHKSMFTDEYEQILVKEDADESNGNARGNRRMHI